MESASFTTLLPEGLTGGPSDDVAKSTAASDPGAVVYEAARSDALVAIIIVSFNGKDLLRPCLASLERHPLTLGQSEIHVVDNASSDGAVDMVRREFPHVSVHPLDENVGFSAANNVALRAVTATYVLLLNPDTEIGAGTIDHMVGQMIKDPSIGMSGCRLVRPDGTFDHAAKRSFPTLLAAVAHLFHIGRRSSANPRLAQYRSPDVDEQGVGPVDAINGAFMLTRLEAIQDVGLLDDGYWMYGEDLDWCYRFHQRGWKLIYDGRVDTLHVKGASAGKHRRLRQNYAFHQAMGRFYRKFYAGDRGWLDVVVFSGIAVRFLISAMLSSLARRARA